MSTVKFYIFFLFHFSPSTFLRIVSFNSSLYLLYSSFLPRNQRRTSTPSSRIRFSFFVLDRIAQFALYFVMKYPQLVSSRAVSEISDWLIKRLEDLDIEQPSVYSRLLLSLLHTPFKVNAIDLLEIPQLKVKFNYSIAARKRSQKQTAEEGRAVKK